MDELLKIPTCTNDKPQTLRSVYDQFNVHIRGLAPLNVNPEQYGSMLIPMITSKLPSDVQLRVAGNEKRSMENDLLEVIKREVEAREVCEGTKLKPHVKPTITNPLQLVHSPHKASIYNVFTVKDSIIQ